MRDVRCEVLKDPRLSKELIDDWCERAVEKGLVPARVWRGQTVGIAPTARLKLRRHIATAAGNKESVFLSQFTEVNDLEVVEDLFTMAKLFCMECVWMCGWVKEQQIASRTQIFEVQTWKQVRGCAGAVICETRELGFQSPQWHILLFEEQVAVDLRVVRPQNVIMMFLEPATMVYWRMWGAKHECDDLKAGVELEPIGAMLGRKTHEAWRDKHRNAMRKWIVGTKSSVEAATRKRARRSTGFTIVRHRESQKPDPRGPGELGAKSKSKEDWKWQKGITSNPYCGGNWRTSHLSVRRWGCEKNTRAGHGCRGLPESRCHQRHYVGSFRQMGCVWVVKA